MIEAQKLDDTKQGRMVRQSLQRLHYQVFGEEPTQPLPSREIRCYHVLTDQRNLCLSLREWWPKRKTNLRKWQLNLWNTGPSCLHVSKNVSEYHCWQCTVAVSLWGERLRARTDAILQVADRQNKEACAKEIAERVVSVNFWVAYIDRRRICKTWYLRFAPSLKLWMPPKCTMIARRRWRKQCV